MKVIEINEEEYESVYLAELMINTDFIQIRDNENNIPYYFVINDMGKEKIYRNCDKIGIVNIKRYILDRLGENVIEIYFLNLEVRFRDECKLISLTYKNIEYIDRRKVK